MSVNRFYIVMTFLDLLSEKKTTVYSLSLDSGVARTTLADIASGKTDILECSGKTLLTISKTLNVSIEDLLSPEREEAKTTLPGFLYESLSNDKVLRVINESKTPISKADIEEILINLSRTTIEKSLGELLDQKKIQQIQSGRYAKYYKL